MTKTQEIIDKLQAAYAENLVGSTFRHYKGGIYQVENLVIDTDDGNIRVLYYRVGGPNFDEHAELGISFVRPLVEFIGLHGGAPRFQRVERMDNWVPVEVHVVSS